MPVSRRNALTMLGLAAAGGVVAEGTAKPLQGVHGESGYYFGVDNAKIAETLRRLADDISSGGSFAQDLTVTSKATLEDFLTHSLSITFVMRTGETGS